MLCTVNSHQTWNEYYSRVEKALPIFPWKETRWLLSLVPKGFSKLFMVISSESNIMAKIFIVFENLQESLISCQKSVPTDRMEYLNF